MLLCTHIPRIQLFINTLFGNDDERPPIFQIFFIHVTLQLYQAFDRWWRSYTQNMKTLCLTCIFWSSSIHHFKVHWCHCKMQQHFYFRRKGGKFFMNFLTEAVMLKTLPAFTSCHMMCDSLMSFQCLHMKTQWINTSVNFLKKDKDLKKHFINSKILITTLNHCE